MEDVREPGVVARWIPKPGAVGLPNDSFPGRMDRDDGSYGIWIPRFFAFGDGMSTGAVTLDMVCLADSSAFAMADARYCSSRLISSSTRGAKSQRRTHFPRFTVQDQPDQTGGPRNRILDGSREGKVTHFFDLPGSGSNHGGLPRPRRPRRQSSD